jgi:transglutaminase-like putative cysteine protease
VNYRITHSTVYEYSRQVDFCQNEAKLQARTFNGQHCQFSRLEITPAPADYRERLDFFGNRTAYFTVQQPHIGLTVTAASLVAVAAPKEVTEPFEQMPWETVRERLQTFSPATENLEARQFVFDSPMIAASADMADFARASFPPARPLIAAVEDLMRRIYEEFVYDPEFTTIATPLSDVLLHRRGVCQDFAHLAIGCLRAYGLAARYVSGYIETLPAPGEQRLTGADASHAWFSVFIPEFGWLDFDPTNNQITRDQHVTLGWGRDYSDVTPLRGVVSGGGQHRLSVAVDMERME